MIQCKFLNLVDEVSSFQYERGGVPQEGSQEIGNFVGGNLVLKALCECVCVRFDQKALKRVTLFIKFSLFEGRKKTGNNASCVSYTYQYHNFIIKTQENLMGYSQVFQ